MDGWMHYCPYDMENLSLCSSIYWVFIMLQPPAVSCSSAFSVQLSGFSSFSQISRLPFPHWGNVRVRMHYLSSVLKKNKIKIGEEKKTRQERGFLSYS